MFKATVFTPTFNRAHTLSRVYNSLIAQTYKGFLWLIIDDGSTDETKELVAGWLNENKIDIEYHYKKNGGKHTALLFAYQFTNSKYLITIDSDDELTPNAIETFTNEWTKLEDAGIENQFAEISGLTHKPNGTLVGDFYFNKKDKYIDSNWLEMVLKFKNNNEHISCWDLVKLKECVQFSDDLWLKDEVTFSIWFFEATLWARIGRKYKTRYINEGLRIYHTDGGERLMRISNNNKSLYNNLISNKYFLDENLDYFWWNPRYFINLILKFIISGIALKKSPIELIKAIETSCFKLAYIFCFPAGFLAFLNFRYIKRQYWFNEE